MAKQGTVYRFDAFILNIIDANTVEALIDLGFRVSITVRLTFRGLTAPARGEVGFIETVEYLVQHIEGKDVQIETWAEPGDYGQWSARIHVDQKCIGTELLTLGLAKLSKSNNED